jgi:hypothetical protein
MRLGETRERRQRTHEPSLCPPPESVKRIRQGKNIFLIEIKRPQDRTKKSILIPKANISGGTPDELYHFIRDMIRERKEKTKDA